MSLFDFPRINFAGTIQLNPGTANNDDYAQQPGAAVIPKSFGPPYAGQVFGLIDSKLVQARTFGMNDADFIAWVQKTQTFDKSGSPGVTVTAIPAEWNYYGGMDSSDNGGMAVVSVQTAADKIYTQIDQGVAATAVIGATVSYSGTITDVNSEGSPPATQFFIDTLSLQNNAGTTFLSGAASKGACQWLNFYRNINLTADGGAGGYVYHVMLKNDAFQLPGFDDRCIGVICRYYLYNFQTGNTDPQILYQSQQSNPATLQIVGTFAPLYRDEKIVAAPVGRLLISNVANIPTPTPNNNGGGQIALGPAVLQCNGNAISADFSGTFPDNFQTNSNLKFDFGAVTLWVNTATDGAAIGPVDYAGPNSGDQRGWIFDFDISSNTRAQEILKDAQAKFSLQHKQYGTVLAETDYYFVTNQQGIYAEQGDPGDSFLNQGTSEPATVAVYHRGRELGPAECPPISVWQYRSVPIQSPGNVELIDKNFKPGQSLKIDTSQPGNIAITFGIDDTTNPVPTGFPPQSYATFMMPPYITNAPAISLRILPNDEDFSSYYKPGVVPPVGNEKLTFDVVYQKVLRTYYLLYPVMKPYVDLSLEKSVRDNATYILQAIDPAVWMTSQYMPRTRDMSASRRTLLEAWLAKPPAPPA